tara:strand:+ start:3389 stop:3820 length:432 start_codon:yes stop_codon:yes gene_type:complete
MDIILDDDHIQYFQDEIFLLDKSIQEMLMENKFQEEIKVENIIINEKDCFECGICFEQIQDNNVVYLKKCNHKFCQKCIKRVRHRKFQTPCPYCRTLFIKSDIKPLYKQNQNTNKIINKCKCGSTTHRRTNHLSCPLNKKNLL